MANYAHGTAGRTGRTWLKWGGETVGLLLLLGVVLAVLAAALGVTLVAGPVVLLVAIVLLTPFVIRSFFR